MNSCFNHDSLSPLTATTTSEPTVRKGVRVTVRPSLQDPAALAEALAAPAAAFPARVPPLWLIGRLIVIVVALASFALLLSSVLRTEHGTGAISSGLNSTMCCERIDDTNSKTCIRLMQFKFAARIICANTNVRVKIIT